jgi:hypothetical protein
MTAGDIGQALAERIEALVRELLPNGTREGHEWRVGNLHGDRGFSLAVHLGGCKASGATLRPENAATPSIWSRPCLTSMRGRRWRGRIAGSAPRIS